MKVAGNNLKSSILKENNKFLFLQEKKKLTDEKHSMPDADLFSLHF